MYETIIAIDKIRIDFYDIFGIVTLEIYSYYKLYLMKYDIDLNKNYLMKKTLVPFGKVR